MEKKTYKHTYYNIKTTIQNVKIKTTNSLHDYVVAIPTIVAGLDKRNLSVI